MSDRGRGRPAAAGSAYEDILGAMSDDEDGDGGATDAGGRGTSQVHQAGNLLRRLAEFLLRAEGALAHMQRRVEAGTRLKINPFHEATLKKPILDVGAWGFSMGGAGFSMG